MAGMLRISFSSVRAISSRSSRISYVFMSEAFVFPEKPTEKPTVVPERRRHFSTEHDSDKSRSSITRKVVEAIQSEIKAHESNLARDRGVPANLPFTIEDDPRFCNVKLRRDFDKEKIEVTVSPVEEDEDGSSSSSSASDSDSDDGCSTPPPSESVEINVSISKEKKGTFDVGANVSADKIVVTTMSFTKPDQHESSARYYVEGEGDLQRALREYVKKRGIDIGNVGFLYKYMIEKRKDWGKVWTNPTIDDLKNLKKYYVIDDLKNLKKNLLEW